MNIKRIIATIIIFLIGMGGWFILGSASALRSSMTVGDLDNEARALWGSKIVQLAPKISVSIPGTQQVRTVAPSRNEVDIDLEQRRKGLVWYSTYSVTNTDAVSQNVRVHFPRRRKLRLMIVSGFLSMGNSNVSSFALRRGSISCWNWRPATPGRLRSPTVPEV